jgi:hypothetical protein
MINTDKNHKHIYDAHGKQLCCTEETKTMPKQIQGRVLIMFVAQRMKSQSKE